MKDFYESTDYDNILHCHGMIYYNNNNENNYELYLYSNFRKQSYKVLSNKANGNALNPSRLNIHKITFINIDNCNSIN